MDINCDNCNGSRRIYDDEKGEYRPCDCYIRYKFDQYIQPLGVREQPDDQYIDNLPDDNLLDNYYINFDSISTPKMNGCIVAMLSKVFPKNYSIKNIYELYTDLRSDDANYGDVLEFDDPLFIMTCGLDEEYNGYDKEGNEWTAPQYSKVAKQLISKRMKHGQPTWIFSKTDRYSTLRDYCTSKDFGMLVYNQSKSGNVTTDQPL
jgi:hypothetical protein